MLDKDQQNTHLSNETLIYSLLKRLQDPVYLPALAEVNELLELNKAVKVSMGKFEQEHSIYEFWTREYIETLSGYLKERIISLRLRDKKIITILDTGAGDGRLCYFLRMSKNLSPLLDICRIIASDNGSWKITPQFHVEKLDYKEALEKCKPDIVLCSFMPRGEDWTAAFREQPSVKEYIIIGDTDCTGNDDTYGYGEGCSANYDNGSFEITNLNYTPPHERDGFTRTNLFFSRLNHCVYDNDFIPDRSRTLSFRRTESA
ncbi:MAG: hypothetical protein V1858_02640 [Candidatus Gottesmanbacteria bacterium]